MAELTDSTRRCRIMEQTRCWKTATLLLLTLMLGVAGCQPAATGLNRRGQGKEPGRRTGRQVGVEDPARGEAVPAGRRCDGGAERGYGRGTKAVQAGCGCRDHRPGQRGAGRRGEAARTWALRW